jgi:hypothetical protein
VGLCGISLCELQMKSKQLFPFKYFDPGRQRWVEARYKAAREDIAARYAEWEITGPGWTPSEVDRQDSGVRRVEYLSLEYVNLRAAGWRIHIIEAEKYPAIAQMLPPASLQS